MIGIENNKMSRTSRIRLARELLQCAKMVLDETNLDDVGDDMKNELRERHPNELLL